MCFYLPDPPSDCLWFDYNVFDQFICFPAILGFPVTNQALDEVAEVSGVGDDFLSYDVRRECERVIPSVENVEAIDAADTYLFLKANYREPWWP